MDTERLRRLLYEKYFAPTENYSGDYIGVEIEMPVIRLSGDATDHEVCRGAAAAFREKFGFRPISYDYYGNCYSATEEEHGDNLSFDCSYNNMELSFGKEKELFPIKERFALYVKFINEELKKSGHVLSGMGINPNHHINRKDFIRAPRYQMLEGYLLRGRDWQYPMYMHPFYDFGTYASASQVQLDVTGENLIETVKAFTLVEPVKAILFSNAYMEEEPELLCVRDLFWENSTHGINPHNIGIFEQIPGSKEEFLDYIQRTSIFCCERDGHYVHFKPLPVVEYYKKETVDAEYYENGVYHSYKIHPEEGDLSYLRTYKFEDLTYRGTIEFRSCCNQPFHDALSVAAFHVGLMGKTEELTELMENDLSIYHHGYSAGELRKILIKREWPEFIDKNGLKKLCKDVIALSEQGLKERKKGEEVLINCLKERAENLCPPALKMIEGLESGDSIEEWVLKYSEPQ